MSQSDIEGLKATLTQSSPIGRMGTAHEIADTVFFLSSDKASYINGIELSVDGGVHKFKIIMKSLFTREASSSFSYTFTKQPFG